MPVAERSTKRPLGTRQVRCAIYTRKSTEEGLDQEFNSLDAQYEACAAYIASQRHEGWSLLSGRYDDGGFSGGNMERPAMKRLLADVEAGRVDTIVVYKVDRLTRALSDFAKIVEVLDARGASFVSITQSFNTTTSMGRLTLNVLLSFAQFEREVISERVRDKVAASRKKGMWMGGSVPLGYDILERKLVVNTAEAETVRHIMRRYVALGCGRLLLEELLRDGVSTKQSHQRGGIPFARGSLFYLLNNRAYLGEARHRDAHYPGDHEPIVDAELWDAVQATITARRNSATRRASSASPSLLAGILFDKLGRRMVPSHANKSGRRYRYYVTAADAVTDIAPAARLPAHDAEEMVRARLGSFLTSKAELRRELMINDAAELGAVAAAAAMLAARIKRGVQLTILVQRVDLGDAAVLVTINREALSKLLAIDCPPGAAPITIAGSALRVRHGKEVRLILNEPGASEDRARNPHLVALLTEAAGAKQLVDRSSGLSISQIAEQAGRCRSYLAKLYKLAHLAPDIVELIMSGRQPARLTTRMLLAGKLPAAWSEQRSLLGTA
jgi:DNA invertase Pin-like site-specific DNA recombinase